MWIYFMENTIGRTRLDVTGRPVHGHAGVCGTGSRVDDALDRGSGETDAAVFAGRRQQPGHNIPAATDVGVRQFVRVPGDLVRGHVLRGCRADNRQCGGETVSVRGRTGRVRSLFQ